MRRALKVGKIGNPEDLETRNTDEGAIDKKQKAIVLARKLGYWYDIETGSIVTGEQADILVCDGSRVREPNNKLLGISPASVKDFAQLMMPEISACFFISKEPLLPEQYGIKFVMKPHVIVNNVRRKPKKDEYKTVKEIVIHGFRNFGRVMKYAYKIEKDVVSVMIAMVGTTEVNSYRGGLVLTEHGIVLQLTYMKVNISNVSILNKFTLKLLRAQEEPQPQQSLRFDRAEIVQQNRSGEDRTFHKTIEMNEGRLEMNCVFDGHGGDGVVNTIIGYLNEHINVFNPIFEYILRNEDSTAINDLAKTAFATIETHLEDIRNSRQGQEMIRRSGSCAMIGIQNLANGKTYFMHLGDSRAVWKTSDGNIRGTKDHKPNNPDEVARITAAGGFVAMGRVSGVLAVSRAFGDFDLKPYVSVVPTVTGPIILGSGCVYAMASDGVWDSMSNEDVIGIVSSLPPREACHSILQTARTGSSDDISIIVVKML